MKPLKASEGARQMGWWSLRDADGRVTGIRYVYFKMAEEQRARLRKWFPAVIFTDYGDEVEVVIPA